MGSDVRMIKIIFVEFKPGEKSIIRILHFNSKEKMLELIIFYEHKKI